jgi:hypothetical protein
MADGGNNPLPGSGTGMPVPPVGAPGQPPPPGMPVAAPSAPIYDFKALPALILRILKDPLGSLEAHYKPGKPALIGGAIIGGGTVILIPLIQALFLKWASESNVNLSAGMIFKMILGGVVFLAVGVGLSFILRKSLGKSPGNDWQDDVYIFGGSLLFFLAGALVGGILMLMKGDFFPRVGIIVQYCGLLLAAFTFHSGLVKVGHANPAGAVWVAVISLAGAALVGSLLNFNPITSGQELMMAAMASLQNDIMRGQRDAMEGIFKGMPR